MARLGYEKSQLLLRMEKAVGLVEAVERVDHAAPQPLMELRVVSIVNGEDELTTCLVRRTALLEFLRVEEAAAVEAAHRVMHGVTGD